MTDDIDLCRTQVGASIMRAALEAIQELHVPYVNKSAYKTCMRCGITWPCITRRHADQGLGGGQDG